MNEIDKIVALLKYLGIKIDMDVFGDRKLFQKLVYLFHEIGLVKEDYKFSIYLQGPYSKTLARIGFENKNKLKNLETKYNISEYEMKKMTKMKKIFAGWLTNTDKMELVTSIMLLKQQEGLKWKEKLREIKPRFSDEKILVAEQRIKELLFDENDISEKMKKEMKSWDKLSGDMIE